MVAFFIAFIIISTIICVFWMYLINCVDNHENEYEIENEVNSPL